MKRLVRDDSGFTLAELLIATVIMAIIAVPLVAVVFVGVHDTKQVVDGFYQSHDPQLGSSFFTTDVQSSDNLYTSAIVRKSIDLNGGTFSSADVGWIVGKGGAIAGTEDGGATWQSSDSVGTADLYDADSPVNDAKHAWIVGDAGTVLAWCAPDASACATTKDGAWHAQPSGTAANLRAVYFRDANNGIAVGSSGTIIRTTNGGASWTAVTPALTSRNLTAITFRDGTNGVVAGAGGVTIWTNDFFANSGHRGLADSAMPTSGDVTGAYVKDDKHGWFSVSNSSSGSIFRCTDHCTAHDVKWQQQYSSPVPITGLAGTDFNHVWAVGKLDSSSGTPQTTLLCYVPDPVAAQNSCDDVTLPKGTWNQQVGDPNIVSDLNAITALDSAHVVAVGPNGVIETISRTEWGSQTSGTTANLYGVWFKDPNKGFVVGASGTVLRYDGKTWTSVGGFGGGDLRGITAIDEKNLWVVGANGSVYYWDGDPNHTPTNVSPARL